MSCLVCGIWLDNLLCSLLTFKQRTFSAIPLQGFLHPVRRLIVKHYNLPGHLRSQCWLNHPESLKLSSVQHHHFKLNDFKLFSSLALKRINSSSETNGLTQNKQQCICLCNTSVPDMNTDFIDSSCLQESGHEGSTSLFMGVLPERKVLEAVTHDYFNPPVKPCHSGVWLMAGGCFSD